MRISKNISGNPYNKINNKIGYTDISEIGDGTVTGAIVAVSSEKATTITGVLLSGETELEFTNDKITSDSTFDFYTDNYKVVAKDASVSGNTLTMVFDEQSIDVNVKVVIR